MDLKDLFPAGTTVSSKQALAYGEVKKGVPYYNVEIAEWFCRILREWEANGFKKGRLLPQEYEIKASSLRQRCYMGRKYVLENYQDRPEHKLAQIVKIEEGCDCFFLIKAPQSGGVHFLDADQIRAFDAAQDFITDHEKIPEGTSLDLQNPDISNVEMETLQRMLSDPAIQERIVVMQLDTRRIKLINYKEVKD